MIILNKIFWISLQLILFILFFKRIVNFFLMDSSSLKPKKFNRKNFLRWQEQLEAWLVALGLISAIGKILPFNSSTDFSDKSPKFSEEIDYHCRFRILSCLSDDLYETYRKFTTSKQLWQALENTYTKDNEGAMRFTISDFNNFKMVDNLPIIDQIHTFQNLVQEIHTRGSKLDETYQVSCLIDKLFLSWSSFTRELRRSHSILSLTQVLQSIKIEDQFRLREVKKNQLNAKVNLTKSPNPNPNQHSKPNFQKWF